MFTIYDYWSDEITGNLGVTVILDKPDPPPRYGLYTKCKTVEEVVLEVYESITEYKKYRDMRPDASRHNLVIVPQDETSKKIALKVFGTLTQPLDDGLRRIVEKYPELVI